MPFEQEQMTNRVTENEPKNPEVHGPTADDPVLSVFNQFLQRARQTNIHQTSKVFYLPGR